jgi:catechol 2,3-dioxygenase-like lactoylglutathione lyase family enzyme
MTAKTKLGWKTKASTLSLAVLSFSAAHSPRAARTPKRPHISRIAQVTFLSTDLPAARTFYTKVLGLDLNSDLATHDCNWCESLPRTGGFLVNPEQAVSLASAPTPAPRNFLGEITFVTEDLGELLKYLTAQNIQVTPRLISGAQHWDVIGLGYSALSLTDPEGRRISFIGEPKSTHSPDHPLSAMPSGAQQIIHAGFIVRDRAATEHFYKDLLGFRPYWHGGMKDDQTDWVSLQVPDGTDWIEMMVNVSPNADQRLRGIMNHVAIGVTDIHETEKRLKVAGAPVNEEPKIGRDGKWQLNLYDPDLTRVEFMEFTPVQKPCCSEFTGPHPGPQSPSRAPSQP